MTSDLQPSISKEDFFADIPEAKRPKKKDPTKIIMTWGKYRNKLVKDIIAFDIGYARWLYKQEFIKKFEDIFNVLDEHFSP